MGTIRDMLPTVMGMAVLLVFSGFFSGSETALFSLSRAQAKRFADGNHRERAVFDLLCRPERLLGTILVGNMLVNILLASTMASLTERLFAGGGWMDTVAAIALSTFLLMIFGELTPKTMAYHHAPGFSRLAALPLLYIGKVLSPARMVLGKITSLVLRLLGRSDVPGWGTVTEAEIAAMMTAGQAAGVTSAHERELVDHILKLGTIEAHDLMIPRTEILGVRDDLTLGEAYLKACRLRHARIPVYHEDMDDLWGMISVVDLPRWRNAPAMERPLASFRAQCEDPGDTESLPVYSVYVVPETAKVEALINRMRERRSHMAVVVGEYGGTAGILTLEDILEEVVGQISPPEGDENREYVQVGDTVFADGGTHLRTLNEELSLGLLQNGADTLGGFVMEHLGRLPRAGDSFENGRNRFTVIKMAGRRIGAVRVDPLDIIQDEETD